MTPNKRHRFQHIVMEPSYDGTPIDQAPHTDKPCKCHVPDPVELTAERRLPDGSTKSAKVTYCFDCDGLLDEARRRDPQPARLGGIPQ